MDSIHFSRFTRPTGLVGRLKIPRAYGILFFLQHALLLFRMLILHGYSPFQSYSSRI